MTNTDSAGLETGNYLATFLYRAPKKNHDAITQNLKKFIPWFENNRVRIEYYQLAGRETQEEVDSAKQLVWKVWKVLPKLLQQKMRTFGWSYNTLEITTTLKKCTQR
jgi:hypothetical protein